MRTIRVGKLRVPVSALLVAGACAVSTVSRTPSPGRPAYAVDLRLAEAYGCDLAEIKTKARDLYWPKHDDNGTGYLVPAQVGWDACEVLAAEGRPTSADTTQTVDGVRWVWMYAFEDSGERSDATVRWDYRVTFDVDARTGRNRVIGTDACLDVVGSSARIAIQMGADCD